MIEKSLKSLKVTCLLVLGSFFFIIFSGCSKKIEPVKNEVNKAQRPKREKKVVKYSFSMNGELGDNSSTKAHWEDVNGSGGVTFFWDKTTAQNAEMQTIVYNSTNQKFITWDNGEKFSLTAVTPNSKNPKIATLNMLSSPMEQISVRDVITNISPINVVNMSLNPITYSNYFYSWLEMPNYFVNDGDKNLNLFKDYAYIYSRSVVTGIEKISDLEVNIKCDQTIFKPIPIGLRLKVMNRLSKNIEIKKIIVKTLKDGVETKVIPNRGSVCMFPNNKPYYFWVEGVEDKFYSRVMVYLRNKSIIDSKQDKNYYIFLLPRSIFMSYKDITMQFEITANVDGQEVVYTVDKNLANLENNNFKSGYIYTFNLVLDDNTESLSKDYYRDGEVVLAYQGDYVAPSRIIVTGDGYVQEDLKIGGNLDKDMDKAIDAIFEIEPFKSYKRYFQIYKLFALSNETGASGYSEKNNSTYYDKDTKYKVLYKQDGNTFLSYNNEALDACLMAVPGANDNIKEKSNTSVLLLSNNNSYAGTCYMHSNAYSVALCPMVIIPNNPRTRVRTNYKNIIAHEFCGHGFGRLGDEYIRAGNENVLIDRGTKTKIINNQAKGMYLNISVDNTNHPWNELASYDKYKHIITSPEGAHYFGRGVWRCEEKSSMDNNELYFSAYSRFLIYKRIKEAVGEYASLVDFMNNDVVTEEFIPSSGIPDISEYYEEYPRLGEPIIIDVN